MENNDDLKYENDKLKQRINELEQHLKKYTNLQGERPLSYYLSICSLYLFPDKLHFAATGSSAIYVAFFVWTVCIIRFHAAFCLSVFDTTCFAASHGSSILTTIS